MNFQEFRALQEAYLEVVSNQLDERVLGQDQEMRRARTKDDKRLPPSSGKGYADNEKKSISYMNKLTKNNKIIPGMSHESYDLYDVILSHLINEGYADTNENALVIMANMSEEWRENILQEAGEEALKKEFAYGGGKKIKMTNPLELPSAGDASIRKGSRDYGDDRPSSTRGRPLAGYN